MGFGWLLIGYFTATMMALNILGGLFSLIGFGIAAYGAKKLSAYHNSFALLFFASIFMAAISAVVAFADLNQLLYDFMLLDRLFIAEAAERVVEYVKYGGELVFTALLCYSVMSIAKETGERKIVYLAIRNFVIACGYYLLLVLGWIPAEALRAFAESIYLPVWVIVLCVVVIVLNSLMLFSCYAKICDESDVDMPSKPRKPSRFAFINRMSESYSRTMENFRANSRADGEAIRHRYEEKKQQKNSKKKK